MTGFSVDSNGSADSLIELPMNNSWARCLELLVISRARGSPTILKVAVYKGVHSFPQSIAGAEGFRAGL